MLHIKTKVISILCVDYLDELINELIKELSKKQKKLITILILTISMNIVDEVDVMKMTFLKLS